ncbi:DUF4113 domain-containing protein [Pseudomonas huanghezhanensis]
MGVLDEINGRWGRGTLRSGSVPSNPEWALTVVPTTRITVRSIKY